MQGYRGPKHGQRLQLLLLPSGVSSPAHRLGSSQAWPGVRNRPYLHAAACLPRSPNGGPRHAGSGITGCEYGFVSIGGGPGQAVQGCAACAPEDTARTDPPGDESTPGPEIKTASTFITRKERAEPFLDGHRRLAKRGGGSPRPKCRVRQSQAEHPVRAVCVKPNSSLQHASSPAGSGTEQRDAFSKLSPPARAALPGLPALPARLTRTAPRRPAAAPSADGPSRRAGPAP